MKPIVFLILNLISFLSLAYAIDLGIQKDNFGQKSSIQSYSGRITFNEISKNEAGQYPPESMAPEKLVKLGVLAYNEMVKIQSGLPLAASQCPRAMITLASGKDIFFASSMKGDYQSYYKGLSSKNQLNKVLVHCQTIAEGGHRTRLGCGEPNVLDVAISSTAILDPSDSRITTWLISANAETEINAPPCSKGAAGYGCAAIVEEFGLQPISGRIPDSGDGSEWDGKFMLGENPRTACSS